MASICARHWHFKSEVLRQHLKEHDIWGSRVFHANFSHTKQKVSSKCGALQALVIASMAITAIRQLPRADHNPDWLFAM